MPTWGLEAVDPGATVPSSPSQRTRHSAAGAAVCQDAGMEISLCEAGRNNLLAVRRSYLRALSEKAKDIKPGSGLKRDCRRGQRLPRLSSHWTPFFRALLLFLSSTASHPLSLCSSHFLSYLFITSNGNNLRGIEAKRKELRDL